jgi:hypothetical protein
MNAKVVAESIQRPTCSLFHQPPFTPSGLAKNLNLEPFDSDNLIRLSQSLVTHCEAPPQSLHPWQTATDVVPCDECTYGFSDDKPALTCNASPFCKATKECDTCQFSTFIPDLLVPCDTCINKVCGRNGNCQCVW